MSLNWLLRKRVAPVILAVAVLASLVVLGQHMATSTSSPVSAFTLTFVEDARNPARGTGVHLTGVMAKRSDGSTCYMFVHHGLNGSVSVNRVLKIFPDRTIVEVFDSARVRSTYVVPAPANGIKSPQQPVPLIDPVFCSADPAQLVIGRETFLGFDAVRLLIESADRKLEVLSLPRLGCTTVWQRMEFKDATGRMTDYSERKVLSITTGEPAAELFAVSPDYAEMSPSEAHAAVGKALGRPCKDCASVKLLAKDQEYNRLKQLAK